MVAVIKDLTEVNALRSRIERTVPLLKVNLSDIKRKWWHFGLWKPAMHSICRHNNRIFERHLPDTVILSVDVAHRFARHMSEVGNAADELAEALGKTHAHLFELEEKRKEFCSAISSLEIQKKEINEALDNRGMDDVVALGVKVATLCYFPSPTMFAFTIAHAARMASGADYEPYYKSLNKVNEAISGYHRALSEICQRKKKVVTYIDKANQAVAGLHDKKDPILQNYGLAIDERGLFTLKRGSWFCIPWKVSFTESRNDRAAKSDQTPKNIFEIAVLDVGIRPQVSDSPYFAQKPGIPPLKAAFLHHATTLYLSALDNRRLVANEVRATEMKHFASSSLGRVGHTDTGKLVATLFGARRWAPSCQLT